MSIPRRKPGQLLSLVGSVLLLIVAIAFSAQAQTTAFTYQGRLTDAGSPATGLYDIEFRAFDAITLGNQLGVVQLVNVQVAGGLFTVKLDYGGATLSIFNGSARFVELGVRPGGSAVAFTNLSPRQEVTSTPYAIRAANIQQTSGDSVVTALNDASTTTPISESKLDPNLIRLAPAAAQTSNAARPFLRLTATGADSGPFLRFRYNGTVQTVSITQDMFLMGNDGGFLASGNLGVGVIPASGPGFRTMWHPFKSAFRSGQALGTEWDDSNIGFFSWAGGSNAKASGVYSLAFGNTVTASNQAAVAFGSNVNVSGAAGFGVGAQVTCAGTACIAMGNNATADGATAVSIGFRTTADADNSMAFGSHAGTSGRTGAVVFGDSSTTANLLAGANNEFVVRASGGFRFRTNATLTTGCNLAAGSGAFSCSSSKTLKENFVGVAGEDLLARIRKVPVNTWNYIAEGQQVRHMGPFAEDFYDAFRVGTDDKSIGLLDIAGVNFAASKALELRTAELLKKTAALQIKTAEVDQLRSEVNALKSANAKMEQRLAVIEQTFRKKPAVLRHHAANRNSQ